MSVIPAMDHLNEHLALAAISHKYNPAIRAAVAIGKKTLNRYYDWTDYSELYQIVMGTCLCQCLCAPGKALILGYPVLHPHHKFTYFEHSGWRPNWIVTAKKIVQDEFNCSYCF